MENSDIIFAINLNPPNPGESTSPKGSTNKYRYAAGSRLSGVIHALSSKENVLDDIGLVDLCFTGTEKVKAKYLMESKQGDTCQPSTCSESHILMLRNSFPSSAGNATISRNDDERQYIYECPFEFVLPDNLLSSIRAKENYQSENSAAYCKIEYVLEATIGSGKWRGFKTEQKVHVVAKPIPLTCPRIPSDIGPFVKKIYKYNCFDAGAIKFAAHVENSRVDRGGNVVVSFAFTNESTVDILHVEVFIVQSICWKSGPVTNANHQYLDKTKFNLLREERRGLSRKERRRKKRFASDCLEGGVKQNLLTDLQTSTGKGINKVSLTVPSEAMYSCKGDLITVRHELYICIRTRSMGVDQYTPRVPIQIVPMSKDMTPRSEYAHV